jgi:arylformamidase
MGRWIDISMAVTDGLRTNHSKPGEEVVLSYDVRPADLPQRKTVRRISTRLHIGTHVDGPEHLVFGAPRLDEIPIDRFTGRAWIGDMYHKVPRGVISADDLEAAFAGKVEAGDICLLRTGWNSHYAEPDFFDDSPRFGPDAPEWCMTKRLKMMAVDFLCDPIAEELQVGGPDAFKTRLLAQGILVMTNADNLEQVKKDQVTLYAFPIKIVPSEAAPTRAVVWED